MSQRGELLFFFLCGENLQPVRENAEIIIKASKDTDLEVNSEKAK